MACGGLKPVSVSDQNVARARRDLDLLIAAVVALAEGTAPLEMATQPTSRTEAPHG